MAYELSKVETNVKLLNRNRSYFLTRDRRGIVNSNFDNTSFITGELFTFNSSRGNIKDFSI